jgi:predicted protein tyrosine phosphatase
MRLFVCPLEALEPALARLNPTHVVSLLSPDAERPACLAHPQHRRVLALAFHDIAEERDPLVAPQEADIAALIALLDGADSSSVVLFHCWAGVSRSTAAAYIAACVQEGPGSEEVLARRLRGLAPFASPNPRMIELADRLLERSGRMVAAISGIGCGEPCQLGRPFEFEILGGGFAAAVPPSPQRPWRTRHDSNV